MISGCIYNEHRAHYLKESMKALFLTLFVSMKCGAMFSPVVPVELAAYQKFVERVAEDFDRDLKEIEAQYKEKGMTDALVIKSGIFTKTFTRRFVQIRQMDIYTQNIIAKTVQRMIPFMEQVALDMYRKKQECKK